MKTEEKPSSFGFVGKIHDMSNKFYRIAFKQFEFQKKLQGLTVDVERVVNESKYKKVFGGLYNSNNLDDSELDHFSYVILVQFNDIKKLFLKSIDQITFYDNQYVLHKGDLLSFNMGDQRFQFKISEVENFSNTKGVLYQYTLVGIFETKVL